VVDPNGNQTTTSYDSLSRPFSIALPAAYAGSTSTQVTLVVGADPKLSQVSNLLCCFLMQRGSRSDHHGHDRQNPAAAQPRQEVRAGDLADGAVLWRWDQAEAFGATPPDQNPSGLGVFTFNQRLPGQVFDAETNTFYNWHRNYRPDMGRYIQSDQIGLTGGLNTYAYVGGNSLSFDDPTGLVKITGISGAAGETSVHANPGPNATDFRPEHGPDHIHLGGNDGPRARTSDFTPFSDDDAKKMTREQKKFCTGLSDVDKDEIRRQQRNIFDYGTPEPPPKPPRPRVPYIPSMPLLLCPLCTIIYPNGPGGGINTDRDS